MADTDWKRLQKLNGSDAIRRADPQFDSKDEVWFYSEDFELRVWSAGTLYKRDEQAVTFTAPVTARHVLYRGGWLLYVDVTVRGDKATVRRGTLNGHSHVALVDASGVEALLARYRSMGFRDGTPWNATSKKVLERQYRKEETKAWSMTVDGNHTIEERKEKAHASWEAAVAYAEKRVRAQEKAGFVQYNQELWPAKHPNPEPKPAKGAPKRPKPPKGTKFPKPKDAFEAVDIAVAMLKDLHERFPSGHFITELVDAKKDKKRIESAEEHVSFFVRHHKLRLGQWLKAKPLKPKKKESSWDYFLRVYGSATWILATNASEDLPGFYCGNVTGGGWSCLEISADVYDIGNLVDATGNDELEDLEPFHGGWDINRSFAFDNRASNAAGERAIVPFDENTSDMPKKTPVSRIQPFGLWMHQRVSQMTRIAERNLRDLM
ncbi:hypothetical protein LXT21_15395 [Myxococcus sp. K38C18041901]|uniref:hypothetical protein n=1 Tax=Myxococcus guangdongensis TaxID=2906760 RepID=UPI0020A7EDCA|nr:hypothetical protein [Myxococcus guangdongensis]MCP3060168.1 hypothetical protein [Myxococcus guangdongensis]